MTAQQTRMLKHELRTPINHIIGYSDLLAETAGDEGDDAVEHCARTMQQNGDSLASIVDRHFAGHTQEELDSSVEELSLRVSPLIAAIQQGVNRASSFDRVYSRDFERIQIAIRKLSQLLDAEQES